ncbi:MAG: serine/threonine-protein kinase [Lachnospiraceae bacterium]|nr:serine/threonine-protein kinase [Lachnospiraceae bacterium]MDE7183429.1 serine/threonine-protein kinase [Lachnospiraceae bacterium]
MEQLEVNGKNYQILRLLGKGKGGYSYLAKDGCQTVVVKQIHHEPCDYYQFGDKMQAELHDYDRLHTIGIAMPRLLDADVSNERLVKEYIDGKTVYEMVLDDTLPADCIDQVKKMCAVLYPANTNIDYFPTNFILREEDHKLYYVDYECNDYMDEWNFENWGVKYWSRTPEFLEYAENHQNESSKIPIDKTE